MLKTKTGTTTLIFVFVAMIIAGSILISPIKLSLTNTPPSIEFFVYQADTSTTKGVVLPDGTKITGYGIEGARVEVWSDIQDKPLTWDTVNQKLVYRSWTLTDSYGLNFFQFNRDALTNRTWSWRVVYGGKTFEGKVVVPSKEVVIWVTVAVNTGEVIVSPSEYIYTENQPQLNIPNIPKPDISQYAQLISWFKEPRRIAGVSLSVVGMLGLLFIYSRK